MGSAGIDSFSWSFAKRGAEKWAVAGRGCGVKKGLI